ncbi:integrin beta-PS-like [Venturia canescens]|uniref:integrin beta-PS-like n=1 Tax=Venturia canescens TaxID=32260 RepID=UPI001C9C8750|nr:integrin beta-PS-like [Venturia canescens]
MRRSLILFVIQVSILSTFGEHKDEESLCAAQQTCTKCIQTPKCVWCAEQRSAEMGGLVRCVSRTKYEKERDLWCPDNAVYNLTSKTDVLSNLPLLSTFTKDPVQVQPQQIVLHLRRGEEHHVTLKYSQAQDYPVDLYYLMDLSASMQTYRDRLSGLGFQLAEAMRKLTSNFRLGFGSFVDKVVLPMTNTQPEKLESPCILELTGQPCAPPYGFKNQMPLTENVTLFKTRVQEAPVSGNLDAPEGGLDAMMQAMVCTDEIGWRPKARHLLIFSTDASFHIAGDGKLAGIVEPNDGLCHLDKNGFYSHSLLQDYPSISQINRKAREHNVNIIFAVPGHKNSTYQLLSRSLSGTSVGLLEHNSQNVVSLVSGEYEKLVDSVELTDDAPSFVDVRYFSKCLDPNDEMKERKDCGGLRLGNVVEFDIALKVVECPKDPKDWKQTIHIKPRGVNESLTVNLELLCECPCAIPEHKDYAINAAQCEKSGDLVCGVCACSGGFYGKRCECKGNEAGDKKNMDDCKPANETLICSGHGVCKCGVCDCFERPNPQEVFFGKYCQCDNFSCKRSGGLVCGGRGKCECGTCNCLPGWGGETCDCKETNSTCTPPGDKSEICSGRGDCICGSCHCREKNGIRYSGQYCEECPTCPGQRCEELKDCVECVVHNAGPLVKSGCAMCYHQIDVVEKVEEDPEKDATTGARICRVPGAEDCSFVFKYELYRSGSGGDIKIYQIYAQKERDCPTPVNVLGVALGVVISTVILGFLVLLIWKIVLMVHDKREYAKFEKERAMAKWDRGENPLYKQATSTFTNPTFAESTKI